MESIIHDYVVIGVNSVFKDVLRFVNVWPQIKHKRIIVTHLCRGGETQLQVGENLNFKTVFWSCLSYTTKEVC